MKQAILFSFFCGVFTLSTAQNKTPEVKLSGFSHPESVYYDKAGENFYVSNMAGKEAGDGFISKVSKNGKILDHSWVTGLQDPKGMVLRDGHLFVTDVTKLIEINIDSGEIINRIPVPDAKSLNDPALDDNGDIYFSDLSGNKIYRMNGSGEIEEWLSNVQLERPNGLLIMPDYILVAAWSEEQNGNILKIDRETREIIRLTTQGVGNLDGIQKGAQHEFYLSDWATGRIFSFDMDGNLTKILTSEKSSGDILFMEAENKLYVPMNHQNEVWIYDLN
ncbi:SMP-30/gluconolactonase/LRE family protein [Salinimicrobium oceani]|uniref:SMP-30/Gluconolactonase/LRE-like region domain-containing protein n=1 Tax=Salinimicrobium oceani TaxID=2722702 RepID=A0ABX1D2C4_9FLAO|nr:SMP-30/gluconolactonase/LRE family protein [Salinimicrobium oceani]NJW53334.1 hypothetical protein [Salinimicrobium oceani]